MSYPFRAALLDTSVAVKWFVTEEDSERATDLRQAHLWENIRLSEERILKDLETSSALGIEVLSFSFETLKSSIALSLEHDLAVYDAYFLALAQALEMSLITADQRMLSQLTVENGALNLQNL